MIAASRARNASALLATAAVVALATSTAAAEDEKTGRLEELRQRIEESRQRVESHEAQERAIFDRLDELDRRLAGLESKVRVAVDDARRARAALDEIERETQQLGARLARTREAMAARAVALYKAGEVGPIRLLFASTSLRELLQRSATLQTLLEHDGRLAERYERDRAAYEGARSDAEKATLRNEEAAALLRGERAALARERGSKRTLLTSVRRDRASERGLLVELEKSARALEATLNELGGQDRKHGDWLDGSGFAGLRGALPLPVKAPIRADYGKVVDSEFLTTTFRNGVDFAAESGTPVRATARGEVRFAGWFRGYGKIVIVDHGDSYFTVSGHLSEIDVAVGDRVAEGDTLGRVGDTGSLVGPSLYFELRQGGTTVDPKTWFSPDRLAEAS